MVELTAIEHSALTAGLRVYYKYERATGNPYGPLKVKTLSRDHNGPYVVLDGDGPKNVAVVGGRFSLADDEDYGAICFYVEQK